MTIGHVIIEYIGEEKKRHLKLVVRPPMMESGTFSIYPNSNKEKENEPDWYIWFNFNRQHDKVKFPSTQAGALWNRVGKQSGNRYFGGYIETPGVQGGKMYISIVEAKKEGETLPYSHNVLWSAPSENRESESPSYDGGYAAPAPRSIPVTVQNAQGQTTATGSMERTSMPENNMPPIDINEDEIPF